MALRSQIDSLIKSFEYFTFNEEVLKNSLVLYLNVLLMKGSNLPPSIVIHQIKLTIRGVKLLIIKRRSYSNQRDSQG